MIDKRSLTLAWLCTDKWSPALQIRTVLLSIQALLSAPNPDDPLANDVAEFWKTNETAALEMGRPANQCSLYGCHGNDGCYVFLSFGVCLYQQEMCSGLVSTAVLSVQ